MKDLHPFVAECRSSHAVLRLDSGDNVLEFRFDFAQRSSAVKAVAKRFEAFVQGIVIGDGNVLHALDETVNALLDHFTQPFVNTALILTVEFQCHGSGVTGDHNLRIADLTELFQLIFSFLAQPFGLRGVGHAAGCGGTGGRAADA